MCKVMIMSGITEETQDKAWEFIKEMAKEMSSPNTSEKDGIGYAAIDSEGKLFGERWLKNTEAFKHQNPYGSEIDDSILKKFKILKREKVYGNFGTYNKNIKSITLHSRASTNEVTYKNVHPFVEGTTSVIHNGVIWNEDKFYKKYSTCDSEVILHQYIKYNIANDLSKFKKLAGKIDGYYVLGIFAKTKEGRMILDVVKDNRANLEAFFIKELNTIVFATPKYNLSPVEEVCRTLGFTILSKYDVLSNKIQRLDAITGETIACENFKPKDKVIIEPKTQSSFQEYMPPKKEETFKDIFKSNNILPMTPHSHSKKEEEIKERLLEEMVLNDKEYSPEEIEKLILNSENIGNEIEKTSSSFNDDSGLEWYQDDKYTWHKKTLA